jgi:hypothetical protein
MRSPCFVRVNGMTIAAFRRFFDTWQPYSNYAVAEVYARAVPLFNAPSVDTRLAQQALFELHRAGNTMASCTVCRDPYHKSKELAD